MKVAEIDDKALSDLIEACEKKMSSKFKKEPAVVAEVPPEDEDSLEGEDVDKLLEMYREMKA